MAGLGALALGHRIVILRHAVKQQMVHIPFLERGGFCLCLAGLAGPGRGKTHALVTCRELLFPRGPQGLTPKNIGIDSCTLWFSHPRNRTLIKKLTKKRCDSLWMLVVSSSRRFGSQRKIFGEHLSTTGKTNDPNVCHKQKYIHGRDGRFGCKKVPTCPIPNHCVQKFVRNTSKGQITTTRKRWCVERPEPRTQKVLEKACKPRKPRPTLTNPLELDYAEIQRELGAPASQLAPVSKRRKVKDSFFAAKCLKKRRASCCVNWLKLLAGLVSLDICGMCSSKW